MKAMGLTEEQARKLQEVVRGHHLEAIITLALVTGMRRDELLHVQWQRCDLERGEVSVRHTKTKSSDRTIPIPASLIAVLKEYRMRQIEAQLEAGQDWQNLDLVFSDRTGGPLTAYHLLKGFYAILDHAKLPRIRFHDLRLAVWRDIREQVRAKERSDGV